MKIILLTQNTSFAEYQHRMIIPVLTDARFTISACIIISSKHKSLIKKAKHHISKKRYSYLIILLFQTLFRKLFSKKRHAKTNWYSTRDFFENQSIPVISLQKLYTPESLETITSLNPDAMVLFGYHGIIKKSILEIFKKGVFSYHYGDMRKYRGQPAGFWEMYHNEKYLGITVQAIDEGIDRGIPIAEMSVEIKDNDSLSTLSARVESETAHLLYSALCNTLNEEFKADTISDYGKLYSLPTLWQWLYFQIKIGIRKTKDKFRLKKTR